MREDFDCRLPGSDIGLSSPDMLSSLDNTPSLSVANNEIVMESNNSSTF